MIDVCLLLSDTERCPGSFRFLAPDVNLVIPLKAGVANLFRKGPDSKHFRLCRPHSGIVA